MDWGQGSVLTLSSVFRIWTEAGIPLWCWPVSFLNVGWGRDSMMMLTSALWSVHWGRDSTGIPSQCWPVPLKYGLRLGFCFNSEQCFWSVDRSRVSVIMLPGVFGVWLGLVFHYNADQRPLDCGLRRCSVIMLASLFGVWIKAGVMF